MEVIKKVWGEEHWIVNNDYCGKKLILKKNYRCSTHQHKKKDEVFYIIKGKVLLEADGKKTIMKPGDSFHVIPGCYHRFTGLENSEMIEFSSHHDEKDSYRTELSGKIKNEFEDRINSILDNFRNKKILVIGDIMLDKSISGYVSRISPEAPIQVVNVKKEKYVPGGAANVCSNLASLDAKTYLSGVVGKDQISKILFFCCKKKKINYSLVIQDQDRTTTQKTRIIGRNQQLLRIDHENTDKINRVTEKKLSKKLLNKIKEFDAIVISDYAKGVITKDLIRELLRIVKKYDIPVIVDPKPKNKEIYQGVYLIKPNLKEAVEITGIEAENDNDIIKIGEKLVKKFKSNILLTCGEKGMHLFSTDGKKEHLPTKAKEVYDVTGAGDTVAAVIALSLASGANLKEASFIANKSAGIVVEKAGTSTTNVDEIRKSIENE